MTLSELCEPLFLHLCRLNRSSRKGGVAADFSRVRNEIKAVFLDIAKTAATDPRLGDQFRKIEPALLFFVDSMISESPLPFAGEWNKNRLAFEKNELAGDEKFFDLLDETLADPSEQATERLVVFHTCLGLGFTGWFAGQKEHLQRKMLEISARLPALIGVDESARVCPQAYDHVDTSNLIEPPAKKLVGIAIALVGLIVVLFVTNLYMFSWTSKDLMQQLKSIMARESTVPQADGGVRK